MTKFLLACAVFFGCVASAAAQCIPQEVQKTYSATLRKVSGPVRAVEITKVDAIVVLDCKTASFDSVDYTDNEADGFGVLNGLLSLKSETPVGWLYSDDRGLAVFVHHDGTLTMENSIGRRKPVVYR